MIEGGEEEVISPFVYLSVFSSYLTAALFNSPKKEKQKNSRWADGGSNYVHLFTCTPLRN